MNYPDYNDMSTRKILAFENSEIAKGRVPSVLIDDEHMNHMAEHALLPQSTERDAHIARHAALLFGGES